MLASGLVPALQGRTAADRAGAAEGRMIPIVYNVRSVVQRPVSTALTALWASASSSPSSSACSRLRTASARRSRAPAPIATRHGAQRSRLRVDERALARRREHHRGRSPRRDRCRRPSDRSPGSVRADSAREAFDTTQSPTSSCAGSASRPGSRASKRQITQGNVRRRGERKCASAASSPALPATSVGPHCDFAGRDWNVVCHFTAAGSAFESEIWGENEQFMPVFRGDVFQSSRSGSKIPLRSQKRSARCKSDPRR